MRFLFRLLIAWGVIFLAFITFSFIVSLYYNWIGEPELFSALIWSAILASPFALWVNLP